MMFYRQIKGIIAVTILLAIIPFFRFIDPTSNDSQEPILSAAGKNKVAVEILSHQGLSGIYFIEKGSTLQDLLQRIEEQMNIQNNFQLQNAMTIQLPDREKPEYIVMGKMAAAKRLSLGLPLDINQATQDDFMLIPGIGEVMAEKIVSRRKVIGRFTKLDQLTEIEGIKEKKLSKLTPYLFIE